MPKAIIKERRKEQLGPGMLDKTLAVLDGGPASEAVDRTLMAGTDPAKVALLLTTRIRKGPRRSAGGPSLYKAFD